MHLAMVDMYSQGKNKGMDYSQDCPANSSQNTIKLQ